MMAMLNNEGRVNGGLQPLYIGANNSAGVYYPSIEELQTTWTTNTRWDELVFRDAPVSNNTTVSVSSANEKTSFNLSANYYTDQGMYIDDDYSKGGYNLNVSHKIYKNFTIRASNILYLGNRNNNGGMAIGEIRFILCIMKTELIIRLLLKIIVILSLFASIKRIKPKCWMLSHPGLLNGK